MCKRITLAVVDDHQIVIDGIIALLNDYPAIEISFSTTHPSEMLQMLKNKHVDILLTDIIMPEMNGLELSKRVRQSYPSIKIIALSMNNEAAIINSLIEKADIAGYILKNTGKKELINAIEKVVVGGTYFAEDVLNELANYKQIKNAIEEVKLTFRELEIIQLIEKEYSNFQIADALCISERTVETHRKNIFRKTKTNNALGLIKYAYQHKLI